MKNKIHYTFLLTLTVVVVLLAMYQLPPLRLGQVPLRKVDLLSDIRYRKFKPAPIDSDTIVLPVVKPAFVDTCMRGMTCIEEYADSTMRGMSHFYAKLSHLDTLKRPVRIAYFGDSFIEADIFTAHLREKLQRQYGGCGVGYVSMYSPIAGFRRTVKHKAEGWTRHLVSDSIGFNRSLQDLSNQYFIAQAGAYTQLEGQSRYVSLLDTCHSSTLFFRSEDSLNVTPFINGVKQPVHKVRGADYLQAITVKGKIGKVQWMIDRIDSTACFYGVSMDPVKGVVVDNYSVRGSSGRQLQGIPSDVFHRYNKLRTYDLVVLQYGLNVAHGEVTNYDYYTHSMIPVVERIKRLFPQASVLIVSVGDREVKNEEGDLHTMPAVKSLIQYQKKLAYETKVAFWNMYEAMGGEGSIVEMVNSNPPKANLDYTHINFRGGETLAGLLFEAMKYGQQQYEKREEYEKY